MFVIQDVLVSAPVLERKFVCNLGACKGACCWEGDYGAPVEEDEVAKIKSILPTIKKILPEENIKQLANKGFSYFEKENQQESVSMFDDGRCAFLIDQGGVGKCAFEKAYEEDLTDFKKPISCHLYPLRVTKKPELGFECINYDEWDICSAACSLGTELKVPVYRFVKEAIIRKYGKDFFEELEAADEFNQKDQTK